VRLDHYKPCCARMMIGDRVFREITDNVWDPRRRIEEMDFAGVSMQVLSPVPVIFSYWARPKDAFDLSRFLNDHIAEVVRENQNRFVGLGTIPLQDVGVAAQELERCGSQLGFRGVEIGTHVDPNEHCHGSDCRNLDHPSLDVVWKTAEQLNTPVFVHAGDMMGKQRMPKYWLPWLVGMPAETCLAICSMIFGGVFERFPKLRVAFAHGGGAFPFTIGCIWDPFYFSPHLVAIDNKFNPRSYLATEKTPARFYVDSLVHDTEALKILLKLFGPQRVALGSDYPFPLGEAKSGQLIESMNLSASEKAQLLSETAREFVGLNSQGC